MRFVVDIKDSYDEIVDTIEFDSASAADIFIDTMYSLGWSNTLEHDTVSGADYTNRYITETVTERNAENAAVKVFDFWRYVA